MLVVGMEGDTIQVADPWGGKIVSYDKERFLAKWKSLGYMTAVIPNKRKMEE